MKSTFLRLFALSFIAFNFTGNAFNQSDSLNTLIMGVPQYLFSNGLRIDIDKRIKGTNNWVVFSPVIYLANTDEIQTSKKYNTIEGGGLTLSYRKMYTKSDQPKGFYISPGLCYQYVNINTDDYIWKTSTDEYGLKTYDWVKDNYDAKIHKIGGNLTIGMQAEIYPRLLIDFFIGTGIRYSFRSYSKGEEGNRFNNNTFDYGYSGTLFVGGFRLGIGL